MKRRRLNSVSSGGLLTGVHSDSVLFGGAVNRSTTPESFFCAVELPLTLVWLSCSRFAAEATSPRVRLTSPTNLPAVRAMVIARLGPSTKNATTKITAISGSPMPIRFTVAYPLGPRPDFESGKMASVEPVEASILDRPYSPTLYASRGVPVAIYASVLWSNSFFGAIHQLIDQPGGIVQVAEA